VAGEGHNYVSETPTDATGSAAPANYRW
jgi:hypothetical protein